MRRVIVTGRLRGDLEESLFGRIAARRAEDSLSPVHVLVGSNILGSYLRGRLARRTGGHINVRFLTFSDLLRLLDEPDALPLPALAGRAIVEEIVSSGLLPPAFGSASGSAGFSEALIETFTDLLEGGVGTGIAREMARGSKASGSLRPATRELLGLYVGFLEALERSGGSMQERFARAARRLESGNGGREIGSPLLAYGFYDFNGLQLKLLESLGSTNGVVLFMPRTGGDADRFADPTVRRLEEGGWEIAQAEPVERPSPAIELFNAPGEEEEARALVRRVIETADRHDAPFGGMGILLPSKEIYLPLVAEALEEAGVPYYCAERPGGPDLTARRGVEMLLGMISGGLEREALVDFLASAPLAPVEGAGDAYGLWILKSAESGMTGSGGWRRENEALRERLAREGPGGEGAAGPLRAVDAVQRIIERIEGIREAAAGRTSWSGYSGLLSGAVREFFRADGAVEETALVIERLRDLDRFTGPVPFESFKRIALARLCGMRRASGRLMGGGVNLLSLGEARGLFFDHLFIPGLAERIFPSPPRQDPLLPDRERREIMRLANGKVFLSERGRRLEEEALIFSLALDSARRGLVCSYPRMEQETGRERIESSFLRYIEGYSPLGGGLEPRRLHRFGRSGDEPLGPAEYDFLRVVRGEPFLPRGPLFERAVRMEQARTGTGTFTPYEGVFCTEEAFAALRGATGRSHSPTSLERYAACPFAYLLGNLLGLEMIEEPERLIRITPLARGKIVHDILAGLYERLAGEGLLPLGPENRSRVRGIADEVADGYLSAYREREPVGTETFWRIERRFVMDAIERHIESETDDRSGFTPSFFERAFGYGDIDVSIETGSGPVSFHGRIDRVDVGPGRRFRVIDYKTGRLSGKDQDLAGGTKLQLPVYLLAAASLLGRPVSGGEALYLRIGPGDGKRAMRFSGSGWEETEEEFKSIVGAIVECIERGFFPAVPGGLCDYCGARGACLTDARGAFDRKAREDDRCTEYLGMRGEIS